MNGQRECFPSRAAVERFSVIVVDIGLRRQGVGCLARLKDLRIAHSGEVPNAEKGARTWHYSKYRIMLGNASCHREDGRTREDLYQF